MPGTGVDITAGANGSIFLIGTSKRVFKWNGSDWKLLSNDLNDGKHITADINGNPWIIREDLSITRYSDNT